MPPLWPSRYTERLLDIEPAVLRALARRVAHPSIDLGVLI
jgi:hypothetical protein